ncbi:MAG: AIR synthase-related protein, partial [Tepidisphaerales bacterium]
GGAAGGAGGGTLPPGVLHPKRVLTQVVAGVRDYGNRMGIPTVNGAVYFDDRYVANPLVFCGCVGLIPRSRVGKAARAGDAVVVIGGRTGRDGIHGATFSSAELTSTHADEFSHAVQIGNAITQKKMMDVVLQAAERGLFTAITDCGAGGLSSAVGEMGEKLGAEVHLERVPLKYAGLRYDEIWISEAQERMVLAVPQECVAELLTLASSEDVEATVIGHFGTEDRTLRLSYDGTEVGRLSMAFLHDGLPMPTRKAVVAAVESPAGGEGWWGGLGGGEVRAKLLAVLAHPNVASKRFIIRQYDHEVQGMSVVKPLVGLLQRGPSDAAVLQPKPGSVRGVAVGCGLCPWEADPYRMALAAVDEAVRNVVAVGGDLERLALLDNFCWPGTDNERAMGDLVRTAEACRDAALAYGTPFISGKDSLHNQFTDKTTGQVIKIPNTLLVSALAIVPDVRQCVTMDLKRAGSRLYRVGGLGAASALAERVAVHRQVAAWIAAGRVRACHDISDGGWLTAVAEMAIGGALGVSLETLDGAFDELLAGYVVEWAGEDVPPGGVLLGEVTAEPTVRATGAGGFTVSVEELATAWLGTLDW